MDSKDLVRLTGIRPSTIGDYYHELSDRMNLDHIPNKEKRTGKNLIKE